MSAPVCGSCRFFLFEHAEEAGAVVRLPLSGECRRYPPRMVGPDDRVKPGYSRVPSPEWPILDATGWCGEYRPRDPDAHSRTAGSRPGAVVYTKPELVA